MTKLIYLCLFMSFSLSCATAQKGTETKKKDYTYYGEKINAKGALSMAEFSALMSENDEKMVKVEGEIIETCMKKGCWMDMKLADGTSMKVRFKDYDFFVPKEGMGGKTAIIQGHAYHDVTTVAELQHYASDAGKSEEEIETLLGLN